MKKKLLSLVLACIFVFSMGVNAFGLVACEEQYKLNDRKSVSYDLEFEIPTGYHFSYPATLEKVCPTVETNLYDLVGELEVSDVKLPDETYSVDISLVIPGSYSTETDLFYLSCMDLQKEVHTIPYYLKFNDNPVTPDQFFDLPNSIGLKQSLDPDGTGQKIAMGVDYNSQLMLLHVPAGEENGSVKITVEPAVEDADVRYSGTYYDTLTFEAHTAQHIPELIV